MKISIIIPVYNTEQYIQRCLESCVHQDLATEEYEILIINDGSTDNSLKIAVDFARDYKNINIISQDNGGLSSARNSGLAIAKGEYVLFLDSDDWIADNCLKIIVEKFEKEKLDLLKIVAANVYGEKTIRRYTLEEKQYSGLDLLEKGIDFCVPFTIYRRSFIESHQLRFMPSVFHEDNEFTPRAYYYAQRVGCLNDIIYYVYQSPNSITRSVNPKKAYDSIIVSESLSAFSKTFKGRNRKIFDNIIGATLNVSLHNCLKMKSEDVRAFKSFLSLHLLVFRHLKGCTSLKYKMEGHLMALFPNYILEIYKMMIYLDYRKIIKNI